jgi:gas vesicle protein
MLFENEDPTSKALWFVAGVAVGSTIALLFAPSSGRVTRRRIGRATEKGRDALVDSGRDLADKGKELYEKGRKLADEAADMFDRGKKLVEG